jgi:cytochrome P450
MTSVFANPQTLIKPDFEFSRLRQESPVYFDETLQAFVVSRYDDVKDVFTRPEVFSSALALFNGYNYENIVSEILETRAHGVFQPILPMTDPPEHTRIRQTLNQAFSARRIAKFQVYIEGVIDNLINDFINDGQVEVMSRLAVPLPISIIAHLLSVPLERSADIKRWTQAYTACAGNRIASEEEARVVGNDLAEMQNFIVEHIKERREHQVDDVLTDIVNSKTPDGESLADKEILAIAAAFLVAGHETGSLVIVSLFKTLAENPSLVEYLRNAKDQEAAYRLFLEEILRLNPPVRMLPRVATSDTQLAGVSVPAGSPVMVLLASANQDESVFSDESNELVPDRKNANRHMTFGGGPHICIGNMLARAELKTLLHAIVNRFDNIRLCEPDPPLSDYSPVVLDINIHLHRLEITFDKYVPGELPVSTAG